MIKSRFAAAAVGLVAAGTLFAAAGPAFATGSTAPVTPSAPVTPPAACPAPSATAPLYTAKCTVTPTVAGSQYVVTVPGVGTLTLNLLPTGAIDTTTANAPVVSGLGANFTASTPKVNASGTGVTVTFFNAASPKQVYTVHVKATPGATTGAAPTVSAVLSPKGHRHGHDDDHGTDDHGAKGTKVDADHDDGPGAPAAGAPATGGAALTAVAGAGHGHGHGDR